MATLIYQRNEPAHAAQNAFFAQFQNVLRLNRFLTAGRVRAERLLISRPMTEAVDRFMKRLYRAKKTPAERETRLQDKAYTAAHQLWETDTAPTSIKERTVSGILF